MDDDVGCVAGGYGFAPIDPWSREAYMNYAPDGSNRPHNELTGKGLSIQIDWSLDNFDITSITSKRNQTSITTADGDFTAADILSQLRQDYEFDTFSQEFRISSNNDSPLQWMLGAYYSQEDTDTFRKVTYGTQTYPFADYLVTGGLAQAIAAAAIEGYLAAGLPPAGAEPKHALVRALQRHGRHLAGHHPHHPSLVREHHRHGGARLEPW